MDELHRSLARGIGHQRRWRLAVEREGAKQCNQLRAELTTAREAAKRSTARRQRLAEVQGDEILRLLAELEECRRTRALGGPPPPVDENWANADVGRPASADDPNAPAHRRDRNGGEPG